MASINKFLFHFYLHTWRLLCKAGQVLVSNDLYRSFG